MATATDRHVGGRPTKEPGYWGRKVLSYATPLGLTYGDMATAIGVSPTQFGYWMHGAAKVPSFAVESLADLFGVPMDDLRTTPPPKTKRRPARRTA
jgi:hypothetical protein